MTEENNHSRTEAPTPRRREQAREKGQFAQSADLSTGVQLFAGVLTLVWSGCWLGSQLGGLTTHQLIGLPDSWSTTHTTLTGQWLYGQMQRLCSPALLLLVGMAILVGFAQVGFQITLRPVRIEWERLDPRSGWSRLWSWESGVRGLLTTVKVLLFAAATVWVIAAGRDAIAATGFQSVDAASLHACEQGGALLLLLAGLSLAFGVGDYGFRWYRHEQRLRMSRQELKAEHREESGDPHLKARVRKLQREAAQRKGLKDVPRASVVLTNPTHLAIALRYEHGVTSAPVVLAKGEGLFARRIRRIAEQHSIPVLQRRPLVRALYGTAEIGQEIPVEFFQAVAEILVAIYRARGQRW